MLASAAQEAAAHAPLAAAIRELAHAARIEIAAHMPAPDVAPETRMFGLTDRERQVLRLVASGKTNSEIGKALYISTKTASVHVSNILRKMDVTSRVTAATRAQRSHLLDEE